PHFVAWSPASLKRVGTLIAEWNCYGAPMRRHMAALALAVSCAACLWRSYADVLAVHLTVLTQMIDKLAAFAEAGRAPTANDMVEVAYPAQRGRTFLRQFRGNAERDSYRDFATLLDRYEALLKRVDTARTREDEWQAERAHVRQERDTLAALAARIREELH